MPDLGPMETMTRREWNRRALTAMAVLGVGGCATMSPQEEVALGDKAAKEVEQTMGLVRDPRVLEYVRSIAGRLAQAAQPSEVRWNVNVAWAFCCWSLSTPCCWW